MKYTIIAQHAKSNILRIFLSVWIAIIESGQQDGIDLKWQIRKGFDLLSNYYYHKSCAEKLHIIAAI
jgi:hypothetical protein